MSKPRFFKKVAFERRGDVLEVTLRDTQYNIIYHNSVNTNNQKLVRQLITDLISKGVDIMTGWFG